MRQKTQTKTNKLNLHKLHFIHGIILYGVIESKHNQKFNILMEMPC
jgi:hypothetical protein